MAEAAAAAPVPLRFSKMHGAGNDFVVVDLRTDAALAALFADDTRAAALCRRLADRHTGVGCDQILTIEPPRSAGAAASYGIRNHDGSRSGQCGNGARCVAAWVQRDAGDTGHALVLDSPVGTHAVTRVAAGQYRIDMGVPRFAPREVPLAGVPDARDTYEVMIDGAPVAFGAVSMGNPHAVLVVDAIATAPVATLGPALQAHPAFPESANIGFAQVIDAGHVALRVFERGVGETLACGSGACAAAVVLMRRGRVDRGVDVALPGGTLHIEWPHDGASVAMTGPATFVFEGSIDP